MEITPARARFPCEDDWTPLRTPKTPTATISTQLSPYAKEFVPRGLGASSNDNNGMIYAQNQQSQQQQQQQQQHNFEQFQQQQQNFTNGYHQQHYKQQQHQQQQQQQQQQLQQRLQQQQQQHLQQQYNQQQQQQQHHQQQQMIQITSSVQDRLKQNYFQQPQQYQQLQQHQQQHAQHQQQRYIRNRYNYQQQQQQQQQQHQLHQQTSALSSSSSTTTHSNAAQNNAQGQQHQQQQQQNSNSESVETIALDYLKGVMQCLDSNPGQFDIVAPQFVNIYDGMENNEFVLMHAMEDIFEESIKNCNFRYMGAKLYNLLHMLNPKSDSVFHHLLELKLGYHQDMVVQYIKENQQQKVRETALFLAELYMQLRWEGDETQRIQLLADNIIYSLRKLLIATQKLLVEDANSKDTADNVRCICLTLKLAGYDLTKDCATDMTYIIEQLEHINDQAPGKYALAANVINLSKNNWGRKTSLTSGTESDHLSSETARQPEVLRESDEPIFYGPDGRELTAEESEFLTNGIAAYSTAADDDARDPDVDFDNEMDEEHELAYIEFCKENANKK